MIRRWRGGAREWCDVFCERGCLHARRNARRSSMPAARRAEGADHANELGHRRRVRGGRLRRSTPPTISSSSMTRKSRRWRVPASSPPPADGGVLPEAGTLRAGAAADRRGRGRGARDGRQSRRRLSPSMPFAMSLACFAMGLTFEEALVGSHAATPPCRSVGRIVSAASNVGKQCDAVIVNGPAVELLRAGVDPVRQVIKRGRVVVG